MAERATVSKSRKGNGRGHNSGTAPDEVYLRWMEKIQGGQGAVERAAKSLKSRKGELSAIYGAAKEDGVNCKAIRNAFKSDKLDHLDVATDYFDTGRVLRLMKSPLAVQMELFRDQDMPTAIMAAVAGRRLGKGGHALSNPHPPGSEAFVAFENAWHQGQSEVHDTLRS